MRENEPNANKQNNIHILYDGILYQKVKWNEDELTRINNSANIKSHIKIRSSEFNDRLNDVSSLGDTAIIRRITNPMELFNRRRINKKNFNIDSNLVNGNINAQIYDQQLASSNREINQGKFDAAEFVKDLDSATKNILLDSLKIEKSHLVKGATVTALPLIGAGVLFGHSSLEFGKFTITLVSEIISYIQYNTQPSDSIDHSDFPMTRMGIEFIASGYLAKFGLDQATKRIGNYFNQFSDFVPIKHFKDFVKGYWNIKNSKAIVELTDQPNGE